MNDGTNSVVDVAVRQPEAGRRDALGKLDHLHLVMGYQQSGLGHEWDGKLTVYHSSAKACSLGTSFKGVTRCLWERIRSDEVGTGLWTKTMTDV